MAKLKAVPQGRELEYYRASSEPEDQEAGSLRKRRKYLDPLPGACTARIARSPRLRRRGGFMPIQKLRQFLDENQVQYVVITHSKAYTSQAIAESAHISGNELAKTVVLKKDGELCMAVLPASKQVSLSAFARSTNSKDVALAGEDEFKTRFPDCETGAMPPFGNLYGLSVYADKSLTDGREMAFNAGSHLELVKLAYRDFERLVKPTVGDFGTGSIPHAA